MYPFVMILSLLSLSVVIYGKNRENERWNVTSCGLYNGNYPFYPIGGYIINPSKYHHISFFNATNHSEIPIGDYFWDKNSLKSQRYLHKWGNIHNFWGFPHDWWTFLVGNIMPYDRLYLIECHFVRFVMYSVVG